MAQPVLHKKKINLGGPVFTLYTKQTPAQARVNWEEGRKGRRKGEWEKEGKKDLYTFAYMSVSVYIYSLFITIGH